MYTSLRSRPVQTNLNILELLQIIHTKRETILGLRGCHLSFVYVNYTRILCLPISCYIRHKNLFPNSHLTHNDANATLLR